MCEVELNVSHLSLSHGRLLVSKTLMKGKNRKAYDVLFTTRKVIGY